MFSAASLSNSSFCESKMEAQRSNLWSLSCNCLLTNSNESKHRYDRGSLANDPPSSENRSTRPAAVLPAVRKLAVSPLKALRTPHRFHSLERIVSTCHDSAIVYKLVLEERVEIDPTCGSL